MTAANNNETTPIGVKKMTITVLGMKLACFVPFHCIQSTISLQLNKFTNLNIPRMIFVNRNMFNMDNDIVLVNPTLGCEKSSYLSISIRKNYPKTNKATMLFSVYHCLFIII